VGIASLTAYLAHFNMDTGDIVPMGLCAPADRAIAGAIIFFRPQWDHSLRSDVSMP
jgi:hypothetical protein